jgi:hypothetical protein
MKVAIAKGRLRGKQPKLKPKQEVHLVKLFGVACSTVYRTVQRTAPPAATV